MQPKHVQYFFAFKDYCAYLMGISNPNAIRVISLHEAEDGLVGEVSYHGEREIVSMSSASIAKFAY